MVGAFLTFSVAVQTLIMCQADTVMHPKYEQWNASFQHEAVLK